MSDVTRLCGDVNFCQLIYVTTLYCTSGRVDIFRKLWRLYRLQIADVPNIKKLKGNYPDLCRDPNLSVGRIISNPAWHLELPPLWRHKCYSVNQAWACLGVHRIRTDFLGERPPRDSSFYVTSGFLLKNKYRTRHLPAFGDKSIHFFRCLQFRLSIQIISSHAYFPFLETVINPFFFLVDWYACIHFVGAHNTHLQFINNLIVLDIERLTFALTIL